MRKKVVWLGSVALAGSTLFGGVEACSDAKDSTFGPAGDDGGGSFDAGGGFNTGDGSNGGEAGPVDCTPRLPVDFKPGFKAPKVSGACTEEMLGAYFDVCVAPLDEAACKTWRETEANKACTTCIEPDDGSGPIQQYLERYYQTFNIAGCLSIERSETTDGTCAVAYWTAVQCARDSCTTCLPTQGAKFEDYLKCQSSAKSSACAGRQGDFTKACGTTFNDPDGGAYDCFQQSTDKDKQNNVCPNGNGQPCRQHYVRAMGLFCGAG